MDMDIFKDANVASINGISINVVGSPSVVPGPKGQALQFDDISQKLIMDGQPDSCLGNITSCDKGFTYSFWLYRNELQNNPYTNIFTVGASCNGDSFGIDASIVNNCDGFHCYLKRQGHNHLYDVGIILPRETWVHLAITWSVQNGFKLYQNGCLERLTQVEESKNECTASLNPPTSITIAGYLNGRLDEIYFYGHEMPAEHVFMLYNSVTKQ